jgi:hypothetical protein
MPSFVLCCLPYKCSLCSITFLNTTIPCPPPPNPSTQNPIRKLCQSAKTIHKHITPHPIPWLCNNTRPSHPIEVLLLRSRHHQASSLRPLLSPLPTELSRALSCLLPCLLGRRLPFAALPLPLGSDAVVSREDLPPPCLLLRLILATDRAPLAETDDTASTCPAALDATR